MVPWQTKANRVRIADGKDDATTTTMKKEEVEQTVLFVSRVISLHTIRMRPK